MKVIEARPPNYDEIVKVIGRPPAGACYTWGDVLYVGHPPYGMKHNLTPDLMAHEAVHTRQQLLAGSPAKWWDEYLRNARFRLIQELDAYREQFSFFATAGRQQRRAVLRVMAKDLSGPMYGRIIKFADAMEEIKAWA